MTVSKIMSLIDDKNLKPLGEKFKVDKRNTKITGEFVLKSFVRSSLLQRPISLRSMETLCNNTPSLNKLLKTKSENKASIDHSSLGKCLNRVTPDYFEAIYNNIVETASKMLPKSSNVTVHRFDSTITALAGKMIKDGINAGGSGGENQVKLTVGLRGSLPTSVRFCVGQSEVSEDIALVKAINQARLSDTDVILFDRGISKASTYQDFTNKGVKFVTRMKQNRKYNVKEARSVDDLKIDHLNIISDETITLYDRSGKEIPHNLRLIKAINSSDNEMLFLTNLHDFSVEDVTELYKKRWDIEVFFKFIKQHLGFKHFISHSLNGMKIYMYCLLIAAILFTLFKEIEKKSGFKIALLEFTLLLEKSMVRDIVLLAGGDLTLVEGRV